MHEFHAFTIVRLYIKLINYRVKTFKMTIARNFKNIYGLKFIPYKIMAYYLSTEKNQTICNNEKQYTNNTFSLVNHIMYC